MNKLITLFSLKSLNDTHLKLFFLIFLFLWSFCGFLILYLVFENERYTKNKDQEVKHSHNIVYSLRDVRALWRNIEIFGYGYLLTKSDDILKLFNENVEKLNLSLNDIEILLYNNLWKSIDEKVQKISWYVENYKNNKINIKDFKMIESLFLDFEIKEQFDLILYLESQKLEKKEKEFSIANKKWIVFLYILCFLMFFLFAINFFIIKEAIRRHEFDTKLNNLNNFLESEINSKTLQLKESNKELESFSYSVSHDLRAPLRAIEGFCNILLEDHSNTMNSVVLGYFKRIVENSKKMSKLIDDILSFSRTGRKSLIKVKTDLNEIINNCIKEIQEEFNNKKYNIIIHTMKPILADHNMIKQLYYNLISNAFKFSNKKEYPEIEIGFEISNNSEQHTIYYVKDNGCGFDMKYKGKIFDVFQRLHSTSEFLGNGVGLAICKKIVEKHEGQIWANSSIGNGSIFYFTIGEKKKSCNGGSSNKRFEKH